MVFMDYVISRGMVSDGDSISWNGGRPWYGISRDKVYNIRFCWLMFGVCHELVDGTDKFWFYLIILERSSFGGLKIKILPAAMPLRRKLSDTHWRGLSAVWRRVRKFIYACRFATEFRLPSINSVGIRFGTTFRCFRNKFPTRYSLYTAESGHIRYQLYVNKKL